MCGVYSTVIRDVVLLSYITFSSFPFTVLMSLFYITVFWGIILKSFIQTVKRGHMELKTEKNRTQINKTISKTHKEIKPIKQRNKSKKSNNKETKW